MLKKIEIPSVWQLYANSYRIYRTMSLGDIAGFDLKQENRLCVTALCFDNWYRIIDECGREGYITRSGLIHCYKRIS